MHTKIKPKQRQLLPSDVLQLINQRQLEKRKSLRIEQRRRIKTVLKKK